MNRDKPHDDGLFKGHALDYVRFRADKHEKRGGRKLARHLRKLAADYEALCDKWIPVSEKPPKNYTVYLVSTNDAGIQIDRYGTKWTIEDHGTKVIAYRELPEPYQPENEK